jgi:hypothetical protein
MIVIPIGPAGGIREGVDHRSANLPGDDAPIFPAVHEQAVDLALTRL